MLAQRMDMYLIQNLKEQFFSSCKLMEVTAVNYLPEVPISLLIESE
jgi:hypothetical protein